MTFPSDKWRNLCVLVCCRELSGDHERTRSGPSQCCLWINEILPWKRYHLPVDRDTGWPCPLGTGCPPSPIYNEDISSVRASLQSGIATVNTLNTHHEAGEQKDYRVRSTFVLIYFVFWSSLFRLFWRKLRILLFRPQTVLLYTGSCTKRDKNKLF